MKLIKSNLIYLLFILILFKTILSADTNYGFIYKSINENSTKTRQLFGPIYNYKKDAQSKKVSLLFYTKYENEKREKKTYNFLYPILRYSSDETETKLFLTPLFAFKSKVFIKDNEEISAFNSMLFPVIFYGKDRNQKYSYGLFPVYGNLRRFLGKDEFNFFAFPFYMRTLYNDEEIKHLLFPIFAYSESESLSLRRFFPFYGKMSRPDKYERKFFMYPFYQEKKYTFQNKDYKSKIFFPIYGIENYPNTKYRSFLYPIFRYKENDIKKNFSLLPIIIKETTPQHKRRFYSLIYGKTEKKTANEISGYFLLPFGYFQSGTTSAFDYNNYYFLPLFRYYSKTDKSEIRTTKFQIFPLLKISKQDKSKKIIIPSFDIFLKTSYIEEEYSRWWEILKFFKSENKFRFNLIWSFIEYENDKENNKRIYGFNPIINITKTPKKRKIGLFFNLLKLEKKYDNPNK